MNVIAIVGSRTFTDYNLLKTTIDNLTQNIKPFTIISGGAKGADTLAEQYAKEHNIYIKIIPSDWRTHGRSAGFKRNLIIANECTHLIAFSVDNSKGTQHTYINATQQGKPTRIIHVRGDQQ